MSTPGFTGEFSLYRSSKAYRPTATLTPYAVRPMVLPQVTCEMNCEEWGCLVHCEVERPE